MKRLLYIIPILIMACAISQGCSSKKEEMMRDSIRRADSIRVADSIRTDSIMKDSMEVEGKIKFIKDFYYKYFIKEGDYVKDWSDKEDEIKALLTNNARSQLFSAYDMDCNTGDCMATWLFIGAGLDDTVSKFTVKREDKDDKDKFVVKLVYSHGDIFNIHLQIVRKDGAYKINSIVVTQ